MQGVKPDEVIVDDFRESETSIRAMNGENRVYFYCPDCGTIEKIDTVTAEQQTCEDCGDAMLQINRKYYHTLKSRIDE